MYRPYTVQNQNYIDEGKQQINQMDYQQSKEIQQKQYYFQGDSRKQKEYLYNHDQNVIQSSDQKISSPNKSSQQILQRVFDDEFSIGTGGGGAGSAHKQQIKDNQGDQMNTIAYNLQKLNLNDTQQNHYEQNYQKEASFQNNQIQNNNQISSAQDVDLQLFDSCYKQFLNKIATDQSFVNATYENKIALLIEYFNDSNLDFRLGSLIFLFELIYNFRDSLTDHAVSLILSQIYLNIPQAYENKDFHNVYCSLEIIALIGPHQISYNNIKLLASILIDDALPILQHKAFLALINFDYPGYYALVDIANKDFNDIPRFIMNKFAQTEEIQLSVIIPSLLNDINTGDPKKRISSLAALNRMYSLIWKGGGLPILINLLNEGSLDRQLIVSTIRACGEIGEQALLKILRTTSNSKIKLAISTVLSWRLKKYEENKLNIIIVPYQVSLHYSINLGTMCIYQGDLTPLAFVDSDDTQNKFQQQQLQQENSVVDQQLSYSVHQVNNQPKPSLQRQQEPDYVEVNSRDFMAALQRLLAVKYERFQNQDINTKQHNISGFIKDFTLAKLIDTSLIQQEQEQQIQISDNIVRALCLLIEDKNVQVREAAINTLGIIGLPEAQFAIDSLFKALNDGESQIRAMAAWCCGRLGETIPQKVAKKLIDLLKDSYWKVRTAACVAIGAIGPSISELAFQPLTKILKENTINKLTVCESLVRLGVYGEQILIDLLKNVQHSNFKLKTAIIQSFQLSNVQKPTIDFIIEELFKNANDQMIQVRKACLQTLENLRFRAQDSNITYLKTRNVLPLFYYFLKDVSPEIRDQAMQCICSFGPQAELIFIEGLTKDRNPLIRCECAKGLGNLGVQNFRALLFGLRDNDENVRKITANVIRQNFNVGDILMEYKSKVNQIPALICNIKDILTLPFIMNERTKQILEQILNNYGESIPKQQESQLKQNNIASSQNTNYINYAPKNDSFLYNKSNDSPQKIQIQERGGSESQLNENIH